MGLVSWIGGKLKSAGNYLGNKLKGAVSLGKKALFGESNLSSMSGDDKMMAEFAQEAYNIDRSGNKNGYVYDPSLSGKYEAVYHNPTSNKTIISYRGTKLDPRDIESDVAIVSGNEAGDSRFLGALNHYDSVRQKYGQSAISTTGHSLGGTISQHVNKNRDVSKAYSYNAGSSITAVKDALKCKLPKMLRPSFCDRLSCHKIAGDPISLAGCHYGDAKVYKTKGVTASHSLGNFL